MICMSLFAKAVFVLILYLKFTKWVAVFNWSFDFKLNFVYKNSLSATWAHACVLSIRAYVASVLLICSGEWGLMLEYVLRRLGPAAKRGTGLCRERYPIPKYISF